MYLFLIFGFCYGADSLLPEVVFGGDKIVQGKECVEIIYKGCKFIGKDGVEMICENSIAFIKRNSRVSGLLILW